VQSVKLTNVSEEPITSISKIKVKAEKEIKKQTYLPGLPFDPEDGGSAFLRNTDKLSDYHKSHA
jgi:hypothetical protein